MPHIFLRGEAFGSRKLACAFSEILENRAALKSGSKLPHSESALRAQRLGSVRRGVLLFTH